MDRTAALRCGQVDKWTTGAGDRRERRYISRTGETNGRANYVERIGDGCACKAETTDPTNGSPGKMEWSGRREQINTGIVPIRWPFVFLRGRVVSLAADQFPPFAPMFNLPTDFDRTSVGRPVFACPDFQI